MIITEKKDYQPIIDSFTKDDVISIIGCGECATMCETGGEKQVRELKDQMTKRGLNVGATLVVSVCCNIKAVMSETKGQINGLKKANKLIVLACGSGVQTVSDNFEKVKDKLDVIPGLNTLFLGKIDFKKEFREYCSLCGECIIDKSESICTFTRCPKGLLNGPCGGSDDGKCEVDQDKDCAWSLVYERAKKRGNVDSLKNYIKPKNFAKAMKPRGYKIK